MHPSYKNDPSLGKEVHAYLVKQGLETPMTDQVKQSAEKKIAAITDSFSDIMIELGLNTTDDSLMDTPKRVAKMYVNEIFYGLNYDYFPKCTAIENKMKTNGSFLLEKNINVQSNCEHHFVVIDGLATVAYIADKKLLGLSKLNRIVQFFAKRPQVQERLTEQIRATIQYVAQTDDVAVYVDAKHWCVKSRGIQDTGSSTCTLAVEGVFADQQSEMRREFLNIARGLSILN